MKQNPAHAPGFFIKTTIFIVMNCYDVIVVGGGLAGLTASLHLAKKGHHVVVFEKQRYPRHKVCGEYVSNEIVPYLERLGLSMKESRAVSIDTLQLSSSTGKYLETELPLGGKGISRFSLDNKLYHVAVANGVCFRFESVSKINFENHGFKVITEANEMYTSKIAIGAYGKRSSLDKAMNRDFINRKSAWMAVKAHYNYEDFPENVVALHNFHGGYGGLSKTETGAVNFCYLATYKSFQKEKNIVNFNKNIVARNPFLGEFLQNATPLFEQPLTIAQISFQPKENVENHVLMCGDTAGLIHPLCGNGMAMAIHSAKIAAELIDVFLDGEQSYSDRSALEKEYQRLWEKAFRRRLWTGRRLQQLLLNQNLSNVVLSSIFMAPGVLKRLIKNTHGQPIY